jgi:transposase-like protein
MHRGRELKKYTPEFRTEAVALLERDDRTIQQVADDLGVSYNTLSYWYKAASMAKKRKKRAAATSGAAETEKQKLARLERENATLRRENESLKMDRAILKKAAAFFAKENE